LTVIIIILIFTGGVIIGLILYPLAGMIDQTGINRFLGNLARLVSAPFRLFSRLVRGPDGFLRARQGKGEEEIRKVDAREQQISDSAQVVRGILLSLAAAIQRTDKAASESSQVLGDVRSSIDQMDLPADLTDIHTTLLREIDGVLSSNSALKGELASSREILASQQAQIEKLQTAVRIDGLTQLANRAYFDEKLSEMIRMLRRYNEPFSLMMIDVDNFKEINDSYGHPAGDRILKGVAFKIKESLRDSDFLARFGGDEFGLILMKAGGIPAADVAWKLCTNVRESRFVLDSMPVNVTLSIGVAEADPDDSEESLLKRADRALYRVKETGRNSVSLADKPLKGDSKKSNP